MHYLFIFLKLSSLITFAVLKYDKCRNTTEIFQYRDKQSEFVSLYLKYISARGTVRLTSVWTVAWFL